MPKDAMIVLEPGVPADLEAALRRLPDVEVVSDAPSTSLITEGASLPLTPRVAAVADLDSVLEAASAGAHLLVLVRAQLDDATAARLEDAGVAFVDAAGRAWLPGRPRTASARKSRRLGTGQLRGAGFRLAQLLADYPREGWTERKLAERGDASRSTANQLLSELETAGLVGRRGGGRGTVRTLTDCAAFWRWLARTGAPSRVVRLDCFVRDPDTVPGSAAGRRIALTGGRAADLLGLPVLSGVARSVFRVEGDQAGLEDVPQALGGFRTTRGANMTLIADPGRLAFTDLRRLPDGRQVAPPSRVMLDLYLEPRGSAAVEVFCDLWTARST